MQNHSSFTNTFVVKDNFRTYNLEQCFRYLEQQGKEAYGKSFKIYEEDKPVICKLLIYAIRDKENALKLGLDLNKGIILSGPVGCGKTSIMHLIKPFVPPKYGYKIKSAREVSFEFAKQGYEALNLYTQKAANQNRLTGYCFDDLGAEQQIKHFGNDCNVMAEILINRYENFIENGAFTHITTNLSATEIDSVYGNRVRSRLRSMVNLVSFDRNSKDKR